MYMYVYHQFQYRIIRIDVQAFSCRKWNYNYVVLHTCIHVLLQGNHMSIGGDTFLYTQVILWMLQNFMTLS